MATTSKSKKVKAIEHTNGHEQTQKRLEVLKTYKIYIGGKFPRTESGRYYTPKNKNGELLANVCRSTRKDFRNSVVAARGAVGSWAGKSAFNRSQILYRIAEMMEGRKVQFVEELMQQDSSKAKAIAEVECSIDRLIYYAGWADKYQQIYSSVNPVASSHFNFSVPEPTGVIAVIASEETSLIGLVSMVAPIISGGNTCVILASENKPLCAVTFSEVLHSSDVPGGVVNILTGLQEEVYEHFATHMDVNAVIYCGSNEKMIKEIKEKSANNMKRAIIHKNVDWMSAEVQSPYHIMDTQEIKTTWHPIENISPKGGGY
ncbi:MAG: aldehyde dehydrogenase [Flavobacteriales bacterium]|nr:MAG: aldehyde dehydrogenase [Flavobacteriales bacterium]